MGQNIYQMAKSGQLDRVEVDGLVTMYAALKSTIYAYEELNLAVPDWMIDRQDMIVDAVGKRARAKLMGELRDLRIKQERLKSAEEKRADVEAQIAVLEAELGKEDEVKD